MGTPPPPAIVVGDTWVLTRDLGVGLGSLPAGSEVLIHQYLSPEDYPSSSGEYTVVAKYTYEDWGYDQNGNWALIEQARLLAYPESEFRTMAEPAGGGA